MTSLFLSHSSRDNGAVTQFCSRLRARGYESLFLDFDPQNGIPAGRIWHAELHRHLVAARGVIILCSPNWLASHWCFAEAVYAKLEGKELFPVELEPSALPELFRDRQSVAYYADPDRAIDQLVRGLTAAGIDPANDFSLPAGRSVYPGFASFDVDDAAVFYGRDDETRAILDLCNILYDRRQDPAQARLIAILGVSGSGKSSLVRAGVLARLKKAGDRWNVLEPIEARKGEFSTPLPSITPGQQTGIPVLFIDQFEQLFAASPVTGDPLSNFRALLDPASPPVIVLITLRSDQLAAFQQRPELLRLPYIPFPVGPMPPDALDAVIRRPALHAGIRYDQRLVGILERLFSGEESLPLLGYVLRDIFDRRADRTELGPDLFDERIGLSDFLERRSIAILSGASPEATAAFDDVLLAMVEVTEQGQYLRTPLPQPVPDAAAPLVNAFINQRFLVAREGSIVIAHERLFKDWKRLRELLDRKQDFLRWRRRLRDAETAWINFGRTEDSLLPEALLPEAEQWLKSSHGALDPGDREFIQLSRQRVDVRNAARRSERNRRIRNYAVGSVVAALIVAGVALTVRSYNQRQILLSQSLATRISELRRKPGQSQNATVLLAIEAARRNPSPNTISQLRDAIAHTGRVVAQFQHEGIVTALAFTPDGKMLLSGTDKGTVRVWSIEKAAETGSAAVGLAVQVLRVSADGKFVAAALGGTSRSRTDRTAGQAMVWKLEDGKLTQIAAEPFSQPVYDICISKRANTVLAGDRQVIKTLALPSPASWQSFPLRAEARRMEFSPDCTYAAVGRADGLDVVDGATGRKNFQVPTTRVPPVVFSGDESVIAVANDSETRFFRLPQGTQLPEKFTGDAFWLALSKDARFFASLTGEVAYLWDRKFSSDRLALIDLDQQCSSCFPRAAFAPFTNYAVLSPGDFTLHVHTLPFGEDLFRAGEDNQIRVIAISPDERLIASGSVAGHISLWDLDGQGDVESLDGIQGLKFASNGKLVIRTRHGAANVLEANTGKMLWEAQHAPDAQVVVSRDGTYAITCGVNQATLRNLTNGVTRQILLTSPVISCAFSSNGSTIFIAMRDGRVRVEPLVPGRPEEFLAATIGGGDAPSTAEFSSSGRYLALAISKVQFALVEMSSRRTQQFDAETFSNLLFSPDEESVAFIGKGQKIAWLRTSDVGKILTNTDFAGNFGFTPNSRYLIASTEQGLKAFPRSGGRPLSFVHQHPSRLIAPSFSSDSQLVSSVCGDGYLHVWRLSDQEEVFWTGPGVGNGSVFDPDPRYLWLQTRLGEDGSTMRKIAWKIDDLIPEGCRHARRNLTKDEWKRFLGEERPRKTCSTFP